MTMMDSTYFNDFFQLSKILIYAGLHVGFDMSEEIAELKKIVNEVSEFNDLTLKKLYRMDKALKHIRFNEQE